MNFTNAGMVFRSRYDEIRYVEEFGINLPIDGNHPDNSQIDLNAFCLPKILDFKIRGFITNVRAISFIGRSCLENV